MLAGSRGKSGFEYAVSQTWPPCPDRTRRMNQSSLLHASPVQDDIRYLPEDEAALHGLTKLEDVETDKSLAELIFASAEDPTSQVLSELLKDGTHKVPHAA